METIRRIIHRIKLMMGVSNTYNIEKSFKIMKERNWDKFFCFVDIHDTILEPDYGKIAKKYLPDAKEVLQKLSKRKDICLVLYTCSYPHEISEYIKYFAEDNIYFDYINENPEAENTRGGCFDVKPYMNVLLEDKAGFRPKDWILIDECLNYYKEN